MMMTAGVCLLDPEKSQKKAARTCEINKNNSRRYFDDKNVWLNWSKGISLTCIRPIKFLLTSCNVKLQAMQIIIQNIVFSICQLSNRANYWLLDQDMTLTCKADQYILWYPSRSFIKITMGDSSHAIYEVVPGVDFLYAFRGTV